MAFSPVELSHHDEKSDAHGHDTDLHRSPSPTAGKKLANAPVDGGHEGRTGSVNGWIACVANPAVYAAGSPLKSVGRRTLGQQ
jgi:hypothetical protein